MLESISILGRDVSVYALCALIGFAFAIFYCLKKIKKEKREDMIFMITYALIGALIGAKLLYIIPRIGEIIAYSDLIFGSVENATTYFFAGYVFYGGLIGAFLGALVYCRQFHIDWKEFLSVAIVSVPLFHFFGRIGCFLTGCCYGIESTGFFSVSYYTPFAAHSDASRIPVQLIEAGLNLLLFVYLNHLLTQKKYDTIRNYVLIYSTYRFILEFIRGDELRGVYLLSTSQWIALLLIGACVIYTLKNKDNFFQRNKKLKG